MIKKLQQLKAKKGFTLVELIVVIAIIGVLAAILVPTMMGFVTSSRVTSANSTAASFQDQIEQFLTDCDTKGYGMKQATTSVAVITLSITDGDWTPTLDNDTNFKSNSTVTWGNGGTAMVKGTNTAITESADPTNLLAVKMMDLFPDIQQGAVIAYVKAGHVEAVIYTADTDSVAAADIGAVAGATYDATGNLQAVSGAVDWANKVAEWDEKTAGISDVGLTVGTAPALALGEVA